MNRQNPLKTAAVVLAALAIFTTYRARTFNYCIGYGDRATGRALDNDQRCGGNEKQLEQIDWQRAGVRSKLKLAGSTVARAFGLN